MSDIPRQTSGEVDLTELEVAVDRDTFFYVQFRTQLRNLSLIVLLFPLLCPSYLAPVLSLVFVTSTFFAPHLSSSVISLNILGLQR